jgi:DNA-binding Lrp family transcriptional regulator
LLDLLINRIINENLEQSLMPALDAIDRNILRLLRLDARMSNAKLAAEIGLSPSACLRRIKIMEKSGVIRGYTVLVDTGNADEMIAVIINITLERQTEDYLDRLEAAVRRHPEIRECFLMTGGSDYLLRVEVANAGEFERIHKEILSTLPGVLRIHSSFSIRNVLATRTRGRR